MTSSLSSTDPFILKHITGVTFIEMGQRNDLSPHQELLPPLKSSIGVVDKARGFLQFVSAIGSYRSAQKNVARTLTFHSMRRCTFAVNGDSTSSGFKMSSGRLDVPWSAMSPESSSCRNYQIEKNHFECARNTSQ
jgi:hypothetical protein